MTRPLVVIDKSYLFGARSEHLGRLFDAYQVVMTEALFYELLTAELEHRKRCFARLPSTENPVILVPNVGPILSWEVEQRTPLVDLQSIALDFRFQFNPGLNRTDFDMGQEQHHSLCEWRDQLDIWVKDYADHAARATEAFPELHQYRPGQNTSIFDELKRKVVDRSFLETFYHQNDGWPAFGDVDARWALYIWLQIRLLAALEYFEKRGSLTIERPGKKLENDYLDLEYCLVGCICGALATRDRAMAERFTILRPTGVLVS